MKKIIIALFLLPLVSFAQTDTTKVQQFCEVVATAKFLSNKVTIAIDYGEKASIWKDQRLKDDEGKAKDFNSVIDALNYMGKGGWKLHAAYPVSSGNGLVYHYIFYKYFDKSELEEKK